MAMAVFDTLKYFETLKSAGIQEPQAKVMSEAQNEILQELVTVQLATKQDLISLDSNLRRDYADGKNELRQEILKFRAELKQDIADLRAELKQDIADLRAELKQDIADLRAELKQDIADLRAELVALENKLERFMAEVNGKFTLLYWMIGFLLSTNIAILAKLFTH